MANPAEVYEMSDEDFLKLNATDFKPDTSTDTKADTPVQAPADDTDADDDKSDTDDTADSDEDNNNIDEDADDLDDADKSKNDDKTSDSDSDSKTDDKPDSGIDKPADKPTGDLTEAEFASIGRQLMSEFKANGTTLKMKSVEDAIQLMQMGANYHKKMAGLKPSLKTLKLLENNGLLDPDKLSYLIDLSHKKPEAITQLLKDSKIDPMTIDLESEQSYVPPQRTVNDADLLLDEVLESISDSPAYSKTLTVLGEEWDATSRAAIVKNPEIIRAINNHIENGIYDQVAQAVTYERSLGKLVGLTDFDAYQKVGAYMHENNLFVNTANVNKPAANVNQNKPAPQVKPESDEQIKQRLERKQAASPSRQQKTVVPDNTKYNPLEMSDEDFIKLNKLRI